MTRQDFVEAGTLQPQEDLLLCDGQITKVLQILPRPGPERVHNLEVLNEHVYLVENIGVLVHNKYPKDVTTKKTKNFGWTFNTEGQARQNARQAIGKNPVYLGDNKYRSQDGRWQYRAKPVDTDATKPHIHLEQLNPATGEVIANHHFYYKNSR